MSRINILLAAGGGLCLSAAISLADGISPTSVSATLGVGGSITVHKTVTVSEGRPTSSQVDVFFLADTTGSMGSYISAVSTAASSILASASSLGDVAFGVGEYKDQPSSSGDPYAYRLNTNITTSTSAVATGIGMWSANGGGDYPEANLYGLTQMANTSAWRAGSARIAVWFGDASGHDPSGGATLASTIAALTAQGIEVLAIDLGYSSYGLNDTGQATAITGATGGTLYSGINSGSIVTTINDAITSSFATYSSVGLDLSGAPAGVTVTSTPGYVGTYDRSIDRTFGFDVTFTGAAPGTYDFSIYGTVNGGHVATEADHIVVGGVPDGGSSILLLGLGLAGMGLARRKMTRKV